MFYLNEKVVYPGHGVAEVSRILERNIGGKITTFFELKIISNGMTVLIPTTNLKGVRKISSKEDIESLYQLLSENKQEFKVAIHASSWTKRNRQYQHEISSGDIKKITEIYRFLQCCGHKKELSFGEKHLLAQAESLLVQEIAIVQQIDKEAALNVLRSFFMHADTYKASTKTTMGS